MCNLNDRMSYANVVSKTYQIPKSRIELVFEDFYTEVLALNSKIFSLPFFTVAELPDDWLLIKMHTAMSAPVAAMPKGLHFDSYFHIDQMASLAVCGEGIDKKTEEAHDKLLSCLEESALIATTPVFYVMSGDTTLQYTIVKVGYCDPEVLDVVGAVHPGGEPDKEGDVVRREPN